MGPGHVISRHNHQRSPLCSLASRRHGAAAHPQPCLTPRDDKASSSEWEAEPEAFLSFLALGLSRPLPPISTPPPGQRQPHPTRSPRHRSAGSSFGNSADFSPGLFGTPFKAGHMSPSREQQSETHLSVSGLRASTQMPASNASYCLMLCSCACRSLHRA